MAAASAPLSTWTVEQVAVWLTAQGHEELAELARTQYITGEGLAEMAKMEPAQLGAGCSGASFPLPLGLTPCAVAS